MIVGKLASTFAIFLLPLLVACHTPQSTATLAPLSPTRTPLPKPISDVFPTGVFFHSHGANDGPFCIFEFFLDGTFHYYWMVNTLELALMKPHETGTFVIDGYLYTVTSTDMSAYPPPATYAWTYDGETLTFQVVGEDPCQDRQKTYESPQQYHRLK